MSFSYKNDWRIERGSDTNRSRAETKAPILSAYDDLKIIDNNMQTMVYYCQWGRICICDMIFYSLTLIPVLIKDKEVFAMETSSPIAVG